MINTQEGKTPHLKKYSKHQKDKISISTLKKSQTNKKLLNMSMTSSVEEISINQH